MSAGEICCLDHRSVGVVDGMRPDREKEKLGFQAAFNYLQWNFQQIPASVPAGFVMRFSLGFSVVSGLKRKKTLGD